MKFDEKYSKKQQVLNDTTEDEEESILDAQSPIKIASILEEKVRKNSRDKSNPSSSMSPRSPRVSRLKRQAEKAGLRLNMPITGLTNRRVESATPPIPTTASEMSEYHLGIDNSITSVSPRSPLFSFENLHDVDELAEIAKDKPDTAFTFEDTDPKLDVIEEEVVIGDDDSSETIKSLALDVVKQNGRRSSQETVIDAMPKQDEIAEESSKKPTSSSSSSVTKKSHKKRRSKKRHHHRKTQCSMCRNLCDFHSKAFDPKIKDEGIQVGGFQGVGSARHYLFDPTQDLLFDTYNSQPSTLNLAKLFLTTNPGKSTRPKLNVDLNQDHLENALTEMLRGQLELTTEFLETQKRLYAAYCSSLNNVVANEAPQCPEKV